MFSTAIPAVSLLLIAVTVIFAVIVCFYGLRPYWKAARFADPAADFAEDETCPKASIIVYCQSPEEVLLATIETLSCQDYPDYEIIVVCDAGPEYAEAVSEMLSARFQNVYVTFVQPGSHNLSRRKLANTIGIKASKGSVVVTTVANIAVPSYRWLSELMAPFRGENGRQINVSLGASRIDFSELKGPVRWYRQFDTVMSDGMWIGYAASGKPYRGDGMNLAFRKEVFFREKGYSKTRFLHNGDDDIFVNQISNGSNTRVVAAQSNILVSEWSGSANRVWTMRKAGYGFTARWLPYAPRVRNILLNLSQWAILAGVAGIYLTAWPNLLPLMIGVLILLSVWGVEIAVYRKLATRLGAVRLWWAVVPFLLWRPVANFIFNFDHIGWRKTNYTWQR